MGSKEENQAQEICDWILIQVQNAKTQGALVEIDGRAASSAAASLAVKALGKNASGVILPCYDAPEDIEDAKTEAERLGLSYRVLDLSYIYDSLLHILPKGSNRTPAYVKAGLRALILHSLAASGSQLAVETNDKSGWKTEGAGLRPLLHFSPREVLDLAVFLGVPSEVVKKSSAVLATAEQTTWEAPLDVAAEAPDGISERSYPRKAPAFKTSLLDEESAEAPGERSMPMDDFETYGKSIEALALISKAITSDQYLENILRLIVMVTAEVMRSTVCSLWLVDEKEGVLRLRATQSINSDYLKERTLRVGEGVVGKVVADNRPIIVSDVLQDPQFKEKELARRMGLVSMLSMPMRVKDRVIGVINCYTSQQHTFSDLQMNVLTAVANQAAVAIENTELMVKTKVIQEELERRKVIERAKDLIMKRFNLTGEDAYRWLQKRSMNTRKSMREVAEAVLLAMES
jgi:GAF domain-containing protein